MGKTVVIANPASGSMGDQGELRAAFEAEGVDLEWLETSEHDPGSGVAQTAVAEGATTVVACGGDGTVRAVLQSVAGSSATLGVVPMGTGNLLAANLGLRSGSEAIADAVHGEPAALDVGVVNGERFAVMAGIGVDAMMIGDANPTLKRRFGSVAYVLAALRHLGDTFIPVSVHVDGVEVWAGRAAMVLVGNCGSVSGGVQVFPDARYDDGQLDVAVLAARGLRQWASVAWTLIRRRPHPNGLLRRFRGAEVVVHAAHAHPYELDGELRPPAAELTFGIEPGAFHVRQPLSVPD